MKEITLIVLIVGLFIFFIWAFLKPVKKVKSTQKKEDSKPAQKDVPPEILKEVTMGNYMYDISQSDLVDGVEMVENDEIELLADKDTRSKIEKAFDDIIDIGNDDEYRIDDVDDDFSEILSSVEENFDDNILLGIDDDTDNDENKMVKKGKSLTEEYKGLSKEMKAMLIANVLAKKHGK